MKYELNINCDGEIFTAEPAIAIAQILESQAQKLRRFSDATTWNDTLVDATGKTVGRAELVKEQALHPLFQEIVDMFLSPVPAVGYHHYDWDGGLDKPIECALDFEPAERGAREAGLQVEPDYPAKLTLVTAKVNGVDIAPLLTEKQISAVEKLALSGDPDEQF